VVQGNAIVLIVLTAAVPLVGDEGHHHDELNEQLGAVHFPIFCAPGVQKSFERGVALLHSVAFETAEAAFRFYCSEQIIRMGHRPLGTRFSGKCKQQG
jgi:hypothetical protein